ncbi:MAG: hypothetical protein RLZZ232_896 [Planctomycetota bacterium]
MSFFGTRRSRHTRLFRPTPTTRDRLLSAFRDYRILTLVMLTVVSVFGLLIASQTWNARFNYRTGQIAAVGIQARTDFAVENVDESRRQLDEAIKAAPLVLRHEAPVIERLQSLLRDQLSEMANAETIKDVNESILTGFGIANDGSDTQETSFSVLRNQLRDPEGSKGERIDELMREFDLLTRDARRLGLIDTSAARRLFGDNAETSLVLDRNRAIKVLDEVGNTVHNGVLADVLLQEQLRETGRLGKNWPTLGKLARLQKNIEIWLQVNLKSQLRRDNEATAAELQAARDSATGKFDRYIAGTVIVPAETQLNESHRRLLQLEHDAFESKLSVKQKTIRLLGWTMLITMLVILFGMFLNYASPRMLFDTPRLIIFILMCCTTVLLSCIASDDPLRAEIIPLLAAVMISAIVYSQVVAIMTAFCLSLIISLATLATLGHFMILMTICTTSILPLRRIKSRLVMIKVGFLLAVVSFCAVWGVGVLEQQGVTDSWRNLGIIVTALKFAGWSLVCCYLVAGSLPFIEQAFGIVTDISLLELTGVSHPLLMELSRRAPGTYNHSMTVASMAEAAAESIGANGLLVRVGAYFHDIGKMMKPEYFIENIVEGTENPHNSLAPAMSTLIIIGHVKDGLELAEENNLPEPLHPFITQHHGTTLVEYFYREAARKADVDHRTDAAESSFRYPGPKPQSRETAVLMVADAVESASRTLKEPTPRRIQSLVHEIIMKRLLDGQFDECNLQMNEIRRIEDSLIKSLLAAHHGRVRYPGQKTA